MKKSLYYLSVLSILVLSATFPAISKAKADVSLLESSNISNELISIDTSIVESNHLEVYVNENDPNKEDLIIFLEDQTYTIEDGKLVEIFTPIIVPYATDAQDVTLHNGERKGKLKYAAKGTTVHTGSIGPTELREHKIEDRYGNILNSILSDVRSIGIQKTVTATDTYYFYIQNYSATTQTWNWTITF